MREIKFRLTPIGLCESPRCTATVYAELAQPAGHPFRLCPECETAHGQRLTETVIANHGLRVAIGNLFEPTRGHCTEGCCAPKRIAYEG